MPRHIKFEPLSPLEKTLVGHVVVTLLTLAEKRTNLIIAIKSDLFPAGVPFPQNDLTSYFRAFEGSTTMMVYGRDGEGLSAFEVRIEIDRQKMADAEAAGVEYAFRLSGNNLDSINEFRTAFNATRADTEAKAAAASLPQSA